ncbi:eukaryotic translation initiation factor 4E-binding protein 1-like [Phoca vitulina]|uniref:eukaryotic translation initiation factor 4E-binding protein 1-like n=1 Tax=Phoca vitulina TaxID=9720 RepID=UPI0013963FA2|nr:eukaryotic translation initiation factor 4E-binding protein 1-like [Phoca vitulina]
MSLTLTNVTQGLCPLRPVEYWTQSRGAGESHSGCRRCTWETMPWGSSCTQTPSQSIPTLAGGSLATAACSCCGGLQYPLPCGGTLLSTRPGDTRIIYYTKFLKERQNSPATKTPLRDLPTIPRVTSPPSDEPPPPPPPETSQNHLCNSLEDKPAGGEESHLVIDI